MLYKYIKTWRSGKPPWRNWLARSAVNRKVGGSSPPGGETFSCLSNLTFRKKYHFYAMFIF